MKGNFTRRVQLFREIDGRVVRDNYGSVNRDRVSLVWKTDFRAGTGEPLLLLIVDAGARIDPLHVLIRSDDWDLA